MLTVVFDNKDWEAQNDKPRLPYTRDVLAQIQACVFCVVGKVFFHLAQCVFSSALTTLDFVVSLWWGDNKIYSSFLFSDVTLSQSGRNELFQLFLMSRYQGTKLKYSNNFHFVAADDHDQELRLHVGVDALELLVREHNNCLVAATEEIGCMAANFLLSFLLLDDSAISHKSSQGFSTWILNLLLRFSAEKKKEERERDI